MMSAEEFEKLVEGIFESLPEQFHSAIDNVRIIVEDYPSDEQVVRLKLPSRHHLLGLYQGVALPFRNQWYGTNPVMPDTITLFRKNIESVSSNEQHLIEKIREVLMHEIGHYFGMSEKEIRAAGY